LLAAVDPGATRLDDGTSGIVVRVGQVLEASRDRAINAMLRGKLPGSITAEKQKTCVKNLLRDMADRDRGIAVIGGKTRAAR